MPGLEKNPPEAIRKVFRQSVAIGGNVIAGDSTKLRAQNSKKNIYNKKKIQRHLEYIDKKLEEHNQELATADGDRKKPKKLKIKLEDAKSNRPNTGPT